MRPCSQPEREAGRYPDPGRQGFTITQLIARTGPRRFFLNFAPRVMPLSDLAATALVQNGSRVIYRLLLAAPRQGGGSAQYQAWLESQIKAQAIKGVRIESLESGSPQMQSTWNAPTVSCRWSACCRPCWRPWPWPWRRAASCCATSMPAPCCAAWA
jgi:hypothetical protein